MGQPRMWRKLERHPLSAEYSDIHGDSWKELLDSIRENGFDRKKPIYLAPDESDGDKPKVGEGWQRQRACVELGVKPTYVTLAKGKLEAVIRRDNDARRHESQDQRDKRIEARRARVHDAVERGTPLRTIAKEEGVNVATVHKDARKSGAKSPRESHPATNGKPKFDDNRLWRFLRDVRPVLDKKSDIVGKGELPVLSADLKKDRDKLQERLVKVGQAKNRWERCHELMSALLEEIKLWS